MTAREILLKMFEKYSKCSSYRDRGYFYHNDSDVPELHFTTHFKRPCSVRFEWSGETSIGRKGFQSDSTKSTVLCCNPEGIYSYFDPRNTIDSEPAGFASISEILNFDKVCSGFVSDLVLPLLSNDFASKTRLLGRRSSLAMLEVDNKDPDSFLRVKRSYKEMTSAGQFTFTNTLWIGDNLEIRRFRQERDIKAADKLPRKNPSIVSERSTAAEARYMTRDERFVSDYRFEEVAFDEQISDSFFYQKETP